MKSLTLPLAACLLAASAVAQEGTGSITGTLGLDDARWIVASAGEGPTSSYMQQGSQTQIRLVGTPKPESNDAAGMLRIEINAASGAIETRATDVRIELDRNGSTWIAESENIDLTMEGYQQAGNDLAIAGSFVAQLTEGPQDGLIVEPGRGMTIDGNFQATIPSEDGKPSD